MELVMDTILYGAFGYHLEEGERAGKWECGSWHFQNTSNRPCISLGGGGVSFFLKINGEFQHYV